jgi:alkylation response protein AidB-like acyl-CoA dehydrogenase
MTFLARERDTLEQYLPGLDKQLADIPLLDLEAPGNPGLGLFRSADGPALVVPPDYGGLGASARDAVKIQRAVGSRSPSLAVATTMHHFSTASLWELVALGGGMEWAMLQAIAENRWLVSSGFAEGRAQQHILKPAMQARPAPGGLLVNGSKKPCSLTWSMDVLSASVSVAEADGRTRMAVVLVPASEAGIERRPFWRSNILAGAESDEVRCTDVLVNDALVYYPREDADMDPVQSRGFLWFELLIAASYLGIASGLVERVLAEQRGSVEDRALLAIELEAAAASLHGAAGALDDVDDEGGADADGSADLATALFVRYATERAIERAAMSAAALAGGMAFIGSPDVAYLLSACRALAFHPPSRSAASQPLVSYLGGEPLVL